MHITCIHIDGFKRLTDFDMELGPGCNVIVGDNETGKSSVLEAIHLVLTGQYDGRAVLYSLDPYLFNWNRVKEYFARVRDGGNARPPEILVEAYVADDPNDPDIAMLKGRNNSKGEDCPGLRVYFRTMKSAMRNSSTLNAWRHFYGSGTASRRTLE